jgi:hypothetical protein
MQHLHRKTNPSSLKRRPISKHVYIGERTKSLVMDLEKNGAR